MMDLPTLALTSSLFLQAAVPGQCTLPTAPIINVLPKTAAIDYDYSKSTHELSALTTNTISPYGLSTDQVTGGLHHDRPSTSLTIDFDGTVDAQTGAVCIWYKEITVNIQLQPKIYLAKEFNVGDCAEAVMHHEKKHVKVQRIIMNKYAKEIGKSLQQAVNAAGAQGPHPSHMAPQVKQRMHDYIKNSIESQWLLLENELNYYQQQVDSLEEYNRTSAVCDRFIDKQEIYETQQAIKAKNLNTR